MNVDCSDSESNRDTVKSHYDGHDRSSISAENIRDPAMKKNRRIANLEQVEIRYYEDLSWQESSQISLAI